ncbi:hypothetical protein Trydic_g17161 [Trypoxylus dichotomus]
MTQRGAARCYNIPKSVLSSRISGKVSLNRIGGGRSPVFTKEMEEEIYRYVCGQLKIGHKYNKQQLLRLIGEFINGRNWKTPFKHGIPGRDWYAAFLARNFKSNAAEEIKLKES